MTETAQLGETRRAYDTVAESYAEQLRDLLANSPHDRAVLALFAELAPPGPVADLGCGPGRITSHLASLGLDVFGVDLSPGMVAVARRQHPGLQFTVGQLAALELPDGRLAGALAWYSIIHTPPAELPGVFAEFFRVLASGGYLLLAFQVGDEAVQLRQGYGHELSLTAHRLPVHDVEGMLAAAGFQAVSCLVREPQLPEKTPQAYLLVRKAPDPTG